MVWVWGVGIDIQNNVHFIVMKHTQTRYIQVIELIRINLTEQYTQTNQRPLVKLGSQVFCSCSSSGSLVTYMGLDYILGV